MVTNYIQDSSVSSTFNETFMCWIPLIMSLHLKSTNTAKTLQNSVVTMYNTVKLPFFRSARHKNKYVNLNKKATLLYTSYV